MAITPSSGSWWLTTSINSKSGKPASWEKLVSEQSTLTPTSPIAGTNPESISVLFARLPDSWSDDDLTRIVGHFREQRKNFNANVSAGGRKSSKTPKASAPVGPINLDDLGL